MRYFVLIFTFLVVVSVVLMTIFSSNTPTSNTNIQDNVVIAEPTKEISVKPTSLPSELLQVITPFPVMTETPDNMNSTNSSIESNPENGEKETNIDNLKSGVLIGLVSDWIYVSYSKIGTLEVGLVKKASDELSLYEGEELKNGIIIESITDKNLLISLDDQKIRFDLNEELNNSNILVDGKENKDTVKKLIDKNYSLTQSDREKALESFKKRYDQLSQMEKPPSNSDNSDNTINPPLNNAASFAMKIEDPKDFQEKSDDSLEQLKHTKSDANENAVNVSFLESNILPHMNTVDDFTKYWNAFHPNQTMPAVQEKAIRNEDGTISKQLILVN